MPLPQIPPTFTAVTTGSKEYSIEINDANFETQAWKSSRYSGNQLISTKGINKSTVDDTGNNNRTPIVQKYTRNIYIGTSVIGMDSELSQEDSTLTTFPDFSYAQTNAYITVNSDNSTEKVEISANLTNPDDKKGFYRAFTEDFPIGNRCKISLLDESLKNNLEDFYTIYFNGGKLQHLIRFDYGGDGYDAYYLSSSNDFQYANQSGFISASSTIINKDVLINEFFTGSLIDNVINYSGDSQASLNTPFGG